MTEPIRPNTNVIDIDLSVTDKKAFRFGKDDNRIVYINVSDMGFLGRATDLYARLQELQAKASQITAGIDVDKLNQNDDTEETIDVARTITERLNAVDQEMRQCIDELFQAPVSAAAAPDGSMYDPFNGDFRFNIIISAILPQYENNMTTEFNKMKAQIEKHAAKYTHQ